MGIRNPFYNHLPILIFTILSLCRAGSTRYSITGYDPEDLLSDERVADLFQQWREKHRKVNVDETFQGKRFENFKRNLRYVLERNSTGFTVGLNRFADLSNEEFRENFLKKKVRKLRDRWHTRRRSETECDAPRSLDWRKKGVVTAVKDQGQCGSCWAFSSTGAIEGINAINTGELISLSEQELVNCVTTNDGCDGGYMDHAFEWVIYNGGIDTEANYAYTGVDDTCNATKEANNIVSINEYEDVAESDKALLCATVNQPVSVGIDASTIDFQLYTGGIFDGDCSSDPDDIDHAVLIIGYGSEGGNDYWIVKNSWGTNWGINGYIYIKRDSNLVSGVCAINAMASYPTQTISAQSPRPSPLTPPPSPRPPSPVECGDFSYCSIGQTCCCLYEFFDVCLIYGCCEYNEGVCCRQSDYCCPSEYPICDDIQGLCLKNSRNYVGVAAKEKKIAKHKLPWNKHSEQIEEVITNEPLQWRTNQFAIMR